MDISWGDVAQGAAAGSSMGPYGAIAGAAMGLLAGAEKKKKEAEQKKLDALSQELAPIFNKAPENFQMGQGPGQWEKAIGAGGTYMAQQQANEAAAQEREMRKNQWEDMMRMRSIQEQQVANDRQRLNSIYTGK